MSISGLIIAGGRSSRFGSDKRALRLWGPAGPTLLEHTLALLTPLCAEVIVALNDPEHWPDLPARTVADAYTNAGPLAGMYAGLCAARATTVLVVACDMPFLNPALLKALINYPAVYDALVPQSLNGLEPLHAIYRQSCTLPLKTYLDSGGRAIHAFLRTINMQHPPHTMLEEHDPHGSSFFNLNTPGELAAIIKQ
jgi:molybdopterin-guanine dinucleotide biosynthesis protein A